MFRTRYVLPIICGPLPTLLNEVVEKDVGDGVLEVHIEKVNQCKELPSMEQFRLQHLLDAGVSVKQVSSIMIPADTYPVDSLMGVDKQTNEQEQTNKQQQSTTKGE